MRIISLLPAATEILYALGAGDEIVGVSDDCEYPPEVRSKPLASRSRLPANLTSAEINEAAGQLHQGGSVYHIDRESLRSAKPDLIIAQDVCEVCAVSSAEARAAAEEALCAAPVLSLSAARLSDIIESISVLGRHVGRERQAEDLRAHMERELDDVRRACEDAVRLRTFYVGWLDPLMCEGHWVPEMVELAGGREVIGRAGEYGVAVAWPDVLDAAPEAIVVAPCSLDVARTLNEVDLLERLPHWRELPAVRSGRVFVANSAYFACPGPRVVTGVRILARALHPDVVRLASPLGQLTRREEDAAGSVRWLACR